ncbi:glycoside hydrolase domain-containing protein [Sphingomonas morindae]|uniref:Glycoside hydrolase family 92 protein n=1 Tax=Sphingomonas morindae TaxID=1541170 RepID=A0ABY4XD39_9SPHN|nr:glycoside hydrolase domain-containing protein [Sphingomonas morindae]USI74817.1 glycoside hydrolase family 92 protein [Sphingomonas morindae]
MRRLRPLAALALLSAAPGRAAPADLVDPLFGTLADFGQLSPAATSPFGMVALGPDTAPANHAGYDYAATRLIGFSHTRGVGVGCGGAGGDLLVSLDYQGAPAPAVMDKASERAAAGRYAIRYGDGIAAQMTATRGAGLLRFTLPHAGRVTLRLDPRHSYARRRSARWLSDGADDLRAMLVAGTVCDAGAYRLFSATRILHDGHVLAAALTGEEEGVRSASFAVRAGDTVELRTGLSTVDAAGAAAVRDAELGQSPLATIAAGTRAAWNAALGRVRPEGPKAARALFYSALARVFQSPAAIDDPDRRHRGSDGRIGRSAPGETRYAGWSLWDNYRTQMPLLALLQPERSADIARSLVALYAAGKPRWATDSEPFLTVRTEHAGVALLDMRRKGITGFDAGAALAGMAAESDRLARATPDEAIEAAYDDWATAGLAADLGDTALAARFAARARAYRPVWRAVFERPGDDGDVVKARGLYQGTVWQYRWAPVFDLPWLTDTLGRPRLRAELDHFFDANLFNMTNEPDMQVPWLYAGLGDAQPTADLVRTILTRPIAHPYTNAGKRPRAFVGPSFALAPQGMADGMDDDAGGMTGWYVFATLGLYPLLPGEPDYVVTVPAFRRTVLTLAGGRRLVIRRQGRYDGAILGMDLNGRPLDGPRVSHAALLRGGVLTVRTGAARPAVARLQDIPARAGKDELPSPTR